MFYPHPPYDFRRTIDASRYYTTLGRVQDGAYFRALRAGDGVALVRLVNGGSQDVPEIGAYLLASKGAVDAEKLRSVIERMLNPQLSLDSFYQLAQNDPPLWHVVQPLYGLHILQTETLFEALVITVIEQQIALSAAQRGERWLVEWAGEHIEFEGERYWTFPSAARLAGCGIEDLTPLKITFKRMQVILDIARHAADGSLEDWRRLPIADLYQRLVSLKGVGHWTAAWTLNRGLGELVYVGSADVALRAAAHQYFLGRPGRLSPEATDALFARYGPYAGLATYYTLMKWAFDRYPRDQM